MFPKLWARDASTRRAPRVGARHSFRGRRGATSAKAVGPRLWEQCLRTQHATKPTNAFSIQESNIFPIGSRRETWSGRIVGDFGNSKKSQTIRPDQVSRRDPIRFCLISKINMHFVDFVCCWLLCCCWLPQLLFGVNALGSMSLSTIYMYTNK